MKDRISLYNLTYSKRWIQFMKSTAIGLKLNLALYDAQTYKIVSVCNECPICGMAFPHLTKATVKMLAKTGGTLKLANIIELSENICIIARGCPKCNDRISLEFNERVGTVKELLVDFYNILVDQIKDEQTGIELSAINHINHVILAMFRKENKALEYTIDIILSALIIIFDATGSKLEYKFLGKDNIITKGKCGKKGEKILSKEFSSLIVKGRLSVYSPENDLRAESFLSYLSQECTIALEINYLMELVESRLSNILGILSNLIIITDKRMKICFANNAAGQMLGIKANELLGVSVLKINAPWLDFFESNVISVSEGIKDKIINRDSEKLIDWKVYPIKENEELQGWIIIADDKTDTYRIQTIGENAEKISNTTALLSVLSHEIRNPLASFRGLLQLIKLKVNEEGIKEHLTVGIAEVDRITSLLSEFMLMEKPLELSSEPVYLKSLIEDVIIIMKGETEANYIEIESNLEEVPFIYADASQLKQVFINLIKNSCEAIISKGRISILLNQSNNGDIYINIRDNGPGIPKQAIEMLFKPFYTTKATGTGLGLTVTQSIVRRHGGEIYAENPADGGSSFSVIFPIRQNSVELDERADMLVVTCDELVRIPVEQVLRNENFKFISVFKNGELHFLIDRYKPSIIIVEGILFSKEEYDNINLNYPDIKIITIEDNDTGKFDNPHCLVKPINYPQMVSKIRSFMKNK